MSHWAFWILTRPRQQKLWYVHQKRIASSCFSILVVSQVVSLTTLFLLFVEYQQLYDVFDNNYEWRSAKTGDNGYWTSDSPKNTDVTLGGIAMTQYVTELHVCLSGSGAITHVSYCDDPYSPPE
jgi:hypothetical protein